MSVSFASELKIQVGKYSKSKADDIDTDLTSSASSYKINPCRNEFRCHCTQLKVQ